MATQGPWFWQLLRRLKRSELDKMEADMIMRPFERRDYAGDPAQAKRYWVATRNRKRG